MLTSTEIHPLVDMQQRSYLLLSWMAKAVRAGFIRFDVAHRYSTMREAAEGWIAAHYLNIPENARPPRDALSVFCNFFTTYLKNSFELISEPGKRRYSPGAHCFCPMCSWLVDAPHLKSKALSPADKRRAQRMRVDVLKKLALENAICVEESQLERLLETRRTFEEASLVAYAYDLLKRQKGIATGPAVLALWRGFAWNEAGSPMRDFELNADMIVEAERRLLTLLRMHIA